MAHSTTEKIELHEDKARSSAPVVFQEAETKVEGAKTSPFKTVPDSDAEEDEDVPSIGAIITRIDAQKALQCENNSTCQLLQECSSQHELKEDDEDQSSFPLQQRL